MVIEVVGVVQEKGYDPLAFQRWKENEMSFRGVLSAREEMEIDCDEDFDRLCARLLQLYWEGFTEIVFCDPATGREKILDPSTLLTWAHRG